MTVNEKIGNRISTLRKGLGLSQEALANKAEIDRSYMAGVESGKRNITVKILEKIITALEVDFSFFFNEEGFKK